MSLRTLRAEDIIIIPMEFRIDCIVERKDGTTYYIEHKIKQGVIINLELTEKEIYQYKLKGNN